MTTFSTFRIAIAFCLLWSFRAMAQKPAAETADVSQAEYKVFSAYINHSFVGAIGKDRIGKPISQVIVINHTESDEDDVDDRLDPDNMPPGGVEKYLEKEVPSLRPVTIGNMSIGTAGTFTIYSAAKRIYGYLVD